MGHAAALDDPAPAGRGRAPVAPATVEITLGGRNLRRFIVLFRARSTAELVHFDEIRALAEQRGGRVLTLVGPSATLAVGDPFSADSLRSAIPDLTDRQAFVCGPERLIAASRSGLKAAGVPSSRIHFERSWW